jgi:purine-binding chemotaxis protein CheW
MASPRCVVTRDSQHLDFLLVRVAGDRVGLPLRGVLETMRPPPCSTLHGAAPWVLGVSVIRGAPTPVINLGRALGRFDGAASASDRQRVVTVRAGDRAVALSVDEVLGIRRVLASSLQALPPLLDPGDRLVEALGVLDEQLLLVLREGRLLPEDAVPPGGA